MYVDEMWLECMQGRAMQDVLAAKAIKKRPPRRALGDLTNRPSDARRRRRAADAARRPAEAAGITRPGG